MRKLSNTKILSIAVLSLFLVACGEKTTSDTATETSKKTFKVCDVLTTGYIQSTFADATEVKKVDMSAVPEEYGYRNRFCGYTFTQNHLKYDLGLTLESSTNGNPQALEAAFKKIVAMYKDNDNMETINDVGDEAYYFDKIKNLIVKGNDSVIRIQMSFNSDDHDKVKGMAITIAKDLLPAISTSR